MGSIKSSVFISLDGVIESPETWHFDYFDEEMGAVVGTMMSETDATLLGGGRPTRSSPATGRAPTPTTRSPRR